MFVEYKQKINFMKQIGTTLALALFFIGILVAPASATVHTQQVDEAGIVSIVPDGGDEGDDEDKKGDKKDKAKECCSKKKKAECDSMKAESKKCSDKESKEPCKSKSSPTEN